jgi:hypothetical protein
VVYIAPSQKEAEKIRDFFAGEGLLVKLDVANTGISEHQAFEVLVPEAEAEEAHKLLAAL